MFNKVLIANRGAIACRIIRTLRGMGIGAIAVYADCDADSLHVAHADEAYSLGEGAAAQTYLDMDKLLAIAARAGADAIHPGYGFLSENAEFVRRCERAGIAFIGPTPAQIEAFGLKHRARELALAAGVLRGVRVASFWAGVLALAWFSHGVMVAWSRPPERGFALAEIALALVIVFAASLPGLRARFGRKKPS